MLNLWDSWQVSYTIIRIDCNNNEQLHEGVCTTQVTPSKCPQRNIFVLEDPHVIQYV